MGTRKTLLFCAVMLTASLAIADQVVTDHDRSAQFYNYKTFMWAQEPQSANPSMNEYIINAINAALETRGLCLVTSNADLAVSAFTAPAKKCANNGCQLGSKADSFYAGLPGGWSWYYYWAPRPSITVVNSLEVDSLVVYLFDTQVQRDVWWATGTEAEKSSNHVDKVVGRMFENFPPSLN